MAKKRLNDFLTEDLAGVKEGRVSDAQLSEAFEEIERGLVEGDYDINEVDYRKLTDVMPEAMHTALLDNSGDRARQSVLKEQAAKAATATGFERLWDKVVTTHMKHYRSSSSMSFERAAQILQENAMVPITASWADQFRDRVTTRTVSDFSCPVSNTVLTNLLPRIDMPCSEYTDRKVCEFPMDPPPDFCPSMTNDDDPAQFYGLGKERCWKMPRPGYIHFAFSMHRNLACVNADEFVRNQIEARLKWFDLIDEKNRVHLFLNLLGCDGECNRYPYTYDGTTYANGWMTPEDGGPWTNVITDPTLAWTYCSEGPMCAIEQIFEDMRDPTNNMPVDCGGDFEVMLTRDCKKYAMRAVLGGRTLDSTFTGSTGCSHSVRDSVPGRDNWSTNALYTRWAWDPLVKFYEECYTGPYLGNTFDPIATSIADADLRRRTAELWAANTYLVSKGIGRTWGFGVDFDVSTRTLEGTETWAYFDRGIRWARRYERKATEMWLRPWLSILVRAFDPTKDADGGTIGA